MRVRHTSCFSDKNTKNKRRLFILFLLYIANTDKTGTFTTFARIGEKKILDGAVLNAENKTVTWFFNNTLIAVDNKNYQLMDNGDLIILNMTVSLEGKYERFVGEDRTPHTIILKLKSGIYMEN